MSNYHTLPADRFASAVSAGLRVFPVKPAGKTPAVTWKEFADREPTAAEIKAWDASDLNVGIICGRASGVAVLDVDSAEAQALVDSLELPPTPIASTGKGAHYYFRLPADVELRNRTGIAGQKLDLRAEGGYVVGPGSLHPSGRRYEWVVSPSDTPFADLPSQLLNLLAEGYRRPSPRRVATVGPLKHEAPTRFDRYLESSLGEAIKTIRQAEEGGRNDALFLAGVSLANDVAGAGASWLDYVPALREAALSIGLEEPETDRTLESCWSSGSNSPTEWIVTAREWLHLAKPDVFYHIESGQHLKVPAFNNAFASLWLPKKMTLARWLLDGGFVVQVHDLDYRPDNPDRFVDRDGLVYFNTYVPSHVEAQDGDWSPFVEFVSYLVPDETERDHLLKMMAWTIRRPGQKLRHALLFRSEAQGIGKTMLTEIWTQLLGERNVRKTTTDEVASQFQGFIKETLLVILEELNWGVGPTGYNRLKDIITSDVAVVNEKFMPVRHWPNLATLVILTNIRTPLILEDKDRRIFYIDSPATKREPQYYAEFANWWRENIGVIRAFFDTIDIDEFRPHAEPPMTAAKQALIEDGREDLVKELADLVAERVGVFNRDLVTFEEIEGELGNSMRGKSKTQLKNALRALGADSCGQHRVEAKWLGGFLHGAPTRVSLWAIRNTEFWQVAGAQDRAEEYSREEGRFASWHGLPIGIRHIKDWPVDPRFLFAEGSRSAHAGGPRSSD